MIRPFVVLGLPRSRTFWLSKFLTYQGWTCGHEELRHVRSLRDVQSWLSQPCTGSAETALAPFWRLIPVLAPECRIVLIRRPVDGVLDSLARQGISGPNLPLQMRRADAKLDQIARRADTLEVDYKDLDREYVCKDIFEFCLPYKHDHEWWSRISQMNLQIRMIDLIRYIVAYGPQIRSASEEAKAATLSIMKARQWPSR